MSDVTPESTSEATTGEATGAEAEAETAGAGAGAGPRVSGKQRRARELARSRASLTPEERAAQRAEERRAKAAQRRRYRTRLKERRAAARAAEPAGAAPAAEPVAPAGGGGRPKVRQGIVISAKADKTISVRIDVAKRHRRYRKILRSSTTLHAHDERNDASEGDTVRVQESRPMSRSKRWRLLEVVERAR